MRRRGVLGRGALTLPVPRTPTPSRTPTPTPKAYPYPLTLPPNPYPSNPNQVCSVEELALQEYAALGWEGEHCEGGAHLQP